MSETIFKEATLLLPVTKTQVGLGIKRQKIGAGLLNGWGGMIDPGEDDITCVVRETLEEGGIEVDPKTLVKVAVILFHNEKFDCRVHVFLAPWRYPDLKETEEMGPMMWYSRATPPVEQMMLADREWLPRVLGYTNLVGEVWYSPDQKSLLRPSEYRSVPASHLPRSRPAA